MVLDQTLKGQTVRIVKTNFDDLAINHKLTNIGISPGNIAKVLDYSHQKSLIHLELFGVEYVLRAKDCLKIDVQKVI